MQCTTHAKKHSSSASFEHGTQDLNSMHSNWKTSIRKGLVHTILTKGRYTAQEHIPLIFFQRIKSSNKNAEKSNTKVRVL